MPDIDSIKKINLKISKIHNTVKKQGRYGYYLVVGDDASDVKLATKDHDNDTAKEEFLEKIKGKKKYINCFVYVVDLTIDDKYVTHEHKLIPGPVSLKIKQYLIDKKYNLQYKSGYRRGAVWYTNQDLLNGVFHITDIKKIIKIIHDNNLNIISMGHLRAVDVLDKNFN